jgi:hypothetical protein
MFQGNYTVSMPVDKDDPSIDDEALPIKNGSMTVFLLAMHVNHSVGFMAPGVATMGSYFSNMFAEAEANPKKSGGCRVRVRVPRHSTAMWAVSVV